MTDTRDESREESAAVKKESPSNRKRRGCLVWLGRIAVSMAALALVGALYESVAEAADARAYPPPGQLVDVGGHRLHINCSGAGTPTVVIDAGLGDWSTGWGLVQPEVAKTTRVCTYDRAGWAWSETGPLPRDAAQFAKELHTLLQNANIPGPYVMVGHSLGGLTVRVFAHDYSSEVAGVVLVDSMSPRQFTQSQNGVQPRLATQTRPFNPLVLLGRLGIVRLLAKPLGIIPSAPRNAEAYYASGVHPKSIQAFRDDSLGMPAAGAQAAAVTSFGELPLIVLTARLNDMPGWPAWQTELVQLSSNSQQLIAENSGHNIHFDEPDAAVAAIVKMVERVRQSIQN
jgi:pimeloyl-ACP methyl ester carboxylesterase